MRVDSIWNAVDVVLILSFALGLGLHYAFVLGGLNSYVWIPSLMCIGGAHAVLARAALEALEPSKDRTTVPYTLLRFAAFILGAIYLYATAQTSFGIIDARTGNVTSSLLDTVYFSVITWTSVGYGDFHPNGHISRLIAAIEALDAYLVMAIFIACLLPGLASEAARYRLRERAIWRRYLASKKLERDDKEKPSDNQSPG